MMKTRQTVWTPTHTRKLRELANLGLCTKEVALALGVHINLVRARARRHGIFVQPTIKSRTTWTAEKDATVRELYATQSAAQIAEMVGATERAVYQRAHALGIRKPCEFARGTMTQLWKDGRMEGCRKGHFKAGEAAYNRGVPMREWMPEASIAACRKTQFKANDVPWNWKPVGTYRVAMGMLQVKVHDYPKGHNKSNWEAVHYQVWCAAHGPPPEGHCVVFKPGLHTTVPERITLDRLEVVSRAELMRRNSRHTRYSKEVNELIQLSSRLKAMVNKREKKRHERSNSA